MIEEFLDGPEVSLFAITDGTCVVPLQPAQDFKRAHDDDAGPNTGGMGAYCPAPVVSEVVHEKIIHRIVKPMHAHLSANETPYRGVLFIGLMIDENNDPYVVEFNVRFGDPECQVTLPPVKTDVFSLLYGAATDGLHELSLEVHSGSSVTVVLASEGYPAAPIKGRPISGLEKALTTAVYGKKWVNKL